MPKGSARRSEHTITIDPDLALLVQWHANARGNSLSESINILIGEALRNHEVDVEAKEKPQRGPGLGLCGG